MDVFVPASDVGGEASGGEEQAEGGDVSSWDAFVLDTLDDAGDTRAVQDASDLADAADAHEPAPMYSCSPPEGTIPPLMAEIVAEGLTEPVGVEASAHDLSRLYIIEKAGKIRLVKDGKLVDRPFLDLTGVVWHETEAGLLGLAFHPDYEKNGRFWAYYGQAGMGSILVEFHRSVGDPDVADPTPVGNGPIFVALLSYIHQGGGLEFGGDGNLYLALGERGAGELAQDLTSPVGKILRFDVSTHPYVIPPGNLPNALPEIWDYGLRNPWRISFDPCTGDFYIGDVGEFTREELDIEVRGMGNRNYGWPRTEGTFCYPINTECDLTGVTLPSLDFGHDVENVIIGGYVYRGSDIPALRSRYLFGGTSGRIYSLSHRNGVVGEWSLLPLPLLTGVLVSFGQDAAGEIYTAELTAGTVRRLKPAPVRDAGGDAAAVR
jgi:glucose/arabinose dehydrogenase